MGSMMQKFKKIVVAIAAASLTLCLSACSFSFSIGGFDASGFVKATLDNLYRGESEQYVKVTDDITEEDAAELHENMMSAKVDDLLVYCGIPYVSDEKHQEMEDMFEDIYSRVKYEVQKKEKADNGYTVDVTITPSAIIEGNVDDITVAIEDFFTTLELDVYETEEEFYDAIADLVMDEINKDIDDMLFGVEVTVPVSVNEIDDGKYQIDTGALTRVDQLLVEF